MPLTRLRNVMALSALAALLSACSFVDGDATAAPSSATAAPLAEGTLGAGFWDPSNPPAPEGTLTPSPASWTGVHPKAGYRVQLVVDGVKSDLKQETDVLRYAVHAWAVANQVALTEVVSPDPAHYVQSLQQAIDAAPDLVVVVGNGLVDPLALVSASNDATQFLIVGAEIAEPTHNVTAVDWKGAMFRGEGLGLPNGFDPKSFTPERAADAVAAGTAAVLNLITGIVVWVE
ncbi:hypothetical protein [Nocardioides sp. Kera G14]|uniref:hypothetical protein n=1 Tax=Nocardioides sp. Kera G14 TaxID=2884264 RepID=UPI001D100E2D|nr:hypothetical protein [Nocardioides sp. Kera G14]UDY22622.1 hypothetical protein LH076_11110 [Nocardioides sp. Kera G14]